MSPLARKDIILANAKQDDGSKPKQEAAECKQS